MNKYKKCSLIFSVLAILLANIMCIVVTWDFAYLLWDGIYGLTSFPAWCALYEIIPFSLGIAVLMILAVVFNKKSKNI